VSEIEAGDRLDYVERVPERLAESNYGEIVWNLWGLLPQGQIPVSLGIVRHQVLRTQDLDFLTGSNLKRN
jgi:hypothetical protein